MTVLRTTTEPLPDLIDESLDEAAFLWKRWEADLSSLSRNLAAVVMWTEDRLHGALDGVRVAGAGIVRVTAAALAGEELSRLTVAAHVLAARSPGDARSALGVVLQKASGPRLWAMVRGIEVAELDRTFAPVTTILANGGPEHAAALCRLKAFRRAPPGNELAQAFASNVPALQAEALRAAALSRDESASRFIQLGLRSEDAGVRRAAILAGIRRGIPEAWDAAVALAHARAPEAAPLLPLLGALGSADDHRIVFASLRVPALQRAALFALGHVGTAEAVEICLKGMQDPKLARAAGEAYCAITGADLQRDHLVAADPDDEVSPPPLAADPLDADLVPATHDLWPLPEVEAVRNHWDGLKPRYAAAVRHVIGRRCDQAALVEAIESGPMLRRADWITELAVRTSGRYDVEPLAFASVQRLMMSGGRAAVFQR